MENKLKMKKEPWFYALVSACCGLVLCLLAGCFPEPLFGFVGYKGYWVIFLYPFLLNMSLIIMGILVVRFHKSMKNFKRRMIFLAIPLMLELLSIVLCIRHINSIGWKLDSRTRFWIVIILCISLSYFISFYTYVYNIRTYIISCFIASVLYVGNIGGGMGIYPEMGMEIFFLQPFAVLFPIISVLKSMVYVSDTGDEKGRDPIASTDGAQVRCPFCGKEQEKVGKFCSQCGRELSAESSGKRYCVHCGAKVEAGMLFCKECGTKIS